MRTWQRAVVVPLSVGVIVASVALAGACTGSSQSALCHPRIELVPTPHGDEVFLESIAASPSGEVWAVGGNVSPGVILRWTGGRFIRVPTPTGTDQLSDVAATSADEAWAVGLNGVLHWDGDSWSRSTAPKGAVWGISASAPDDVWAVGGSSMFSPPLVIHWNGRAWKRVPFLLKPQQSETHESWGVRIRFASLGGVLALASNDVWLVGGGATGRPTTAHWDGGAWRVYPVPATGGLTSVAALSPRNLWAGGGDVVAQWNGRRWQVRESLSPSADVAVREREVWAILDDAVARWDGSKWIQLANPDPDIALKGLAVDRSGNVWAAGYRLGSDLQQRSVVYRFRCTRDD